MAEFVETEFRNEAVQIDGHSYTRCRFHGCRIEYSGGGPPKLVGCEFYSCQWFLVGAAGAGLAFLRALWLSGQAFHPIVQSFVQQLTAPPQVVGEFIAIEQGVHDVGTGNDAMVSTVHFVVAENGQAYPGTAIVRQIAGGSFDSDPLEVGDIDYPKEAPQFKFQPFRDLVERYYRALVGPQGRGIGFPTNVTGLRMGGNVVESRVPFQVEPAERAGGPW